MDYSAVAILGLAGGVIAGLTGVGGGILFVPALVLVLDEPPLRAEATSLLAIVPVALAGTWRQLHNDNVNLRDAATLGLLSPLGVGAGVLLANALPPRVLEIAFAALLVVVAAQLTVRPRPSRSQRTRVAAPAPSPALERSRARRRPAG
jgi:hypothetical protein